jgi:hypothetical protein
VVPRSFLETSHLLGLGVSGRSMYFESDQRKCPTAAASSLPTLGNTFLGSSGMQKEGEHFCNKKKGGSPSNPVKKQVCLWSLCEKHVFLLGFFFWATMGHLGSLGRLTTVCTPPGEGRFSQRRGSLGAPALFFGRKCQVECQIYVRSMSVGDHSKNLEDSTLCVFFLKPGGVSNLNTGCHGLQKSAHQIQ